MHLGEHQKDKLSVSDWEEISRSLNGEMFRCIERASAQRKLIETGPNPFLNLETLVASATDYEYRAQQLAKLLTRVEMGAR